MGRKNPFSLSAPLYSRRCDLPPERDCPLSFPWTARAGLLLPLLGSLLSVRLCVKPGEMSHWRGGRLVRTFWAAASRDVMARLLRSKLGPIAITFFFLSGLARSGMCVPGPCTTSAGSWLRPRLHCTAPKGAGPLSGLVALSPSRTPSTSKEIKPLNAVGDRGLKAAYQRTRQGDSVTPAWVTEPIWFS